MTRDRGRRLYRLDCPDINNFDYLSPGKKPIALLTIGGRDIADFKVYLAEGAGENGEYSRDELIKYIELVCGVKLAIGTDKSEYKIALLPDPEMEAESYIIENDGKTLSIKAGMPRGILYGVYEFLERCIGVRFFALDTEICYRNQHVDVPVGYLDEEYPAIEYRDTFTPSYFDADFAARRKVNSYYNRELTEKHGGCISYTGRFVHTMETYLGTPQTEQPCFSDEKNLEKVIEGVRALLREHPEARFVSVTQNDVEKPCTCERCKKVDEEEGSHAGSMLRFVNAVADAVKDEFPDTLIITLAYQHTAKPPKLTKPRDNVIIQFCPIEECCSHAMDDPSCERNADFVRSFNAWRKFTKQKLYVWEYYVNFSFMLPPFPNLHTIRHNIRFFSENEIVGLFAECDNTVPNQQPAEFSDLRAYIVSRLSWNPYMTEEEVDRDIREFSAAFYGDADEICEYISLIEKCTKYNHFHCFANPLHIFHLPTLLDSLPRMDELWNKILSDAEGTVRYDHAVRASLQHTYLVLLQRFDDVMQNGNDDEKVAMISRNREFYENLKKYNLRQSLWRKLPEVTDFSKSVIAYMFEEGELTYDDYDPFDMSKENA